jgi:leucyl/phenylalanyl-tRNA--protein transferase
VNETPHTPPQLPFLAPGESFPAVERSWGRLDPLPGLLAAGADLSPATLIQAYRHGIFPWFSNGQPILWWSPDPRMVLPAHGFRMRRSLRQTLARLRAQGHFEIRFDTQFETVMRACAQSPRPQQQGTWISEDMIQAYVQLHRMGIAHSVETWVDGQLQAGLYGLNIGRAVFGESMFTRIPDGSKLALAALVGFCIENDIEWIDCQQNTRHLSSMGAHEIGRQAFTTWLDKVTGEVAPCWQFNSVYWDRVSRLR